MLLTCIAMAVPPLPTTFFGDVVVNGVRAPKGTVISGWIGNNKYIDYTVGDYGHDIGQYTIDFPGDDLSTESVEGAKEGDTASFKVNGVAAPQKGIWHEGSGFTRVDLIFYTGERDVFENTGSTGGGSLSLHDETEEETANAPENVQEPVIMLESTPEDVAGQTAEPSEEERPELKEEPQPTKNRKYYIIIPVIAAIMSALIVIMYIFKRKTRGAEIEIK
jgi:hypothetical protein